MKKSKILSVLLSLTTFMSTAAFVTPMGANAESETKSVDIFSDDFSGDTLNSAWELAGLWNTTSNCWKLNNGVLYNYESSQNWCTAARAIDVSGLPDEYDLNIEYRVQVDDADADSVSFITVLGTEIATNANCAAGKTAATISINGDKFAQNLTGVHYTTSGGGIELYGADDGYVASDWYTINIVAHVDGVSNATYDYKVYNSDKTMLLAEIDNVSTASYAGSIVEPTYISFYKQNTKTATTSASLDDVKVWATYDEVIPEVGLQDPVAPAGYKMATLMEDDFSGAALDSAWERTGQWGEANWWRLNEGMLYDREGGANWTIASRAFDVSALPDEYDLNVRFRIKGKDGALVNGTEFYTALGTQAAPNANFTAGLNAATLALNGNKWCEDVTGFQASTNGSSTPIYDASAGYVDETWYTVVISAHVDGINNLTFDYKIYDKAGTTLLASLDGVSTSGNAGSVIEPTYLSFYKRNQKDYETYVAIDDVLVYAFYEDMPENARKKTLLTDNFSGTALNATWEVSGQWANPANRWRLSDGTLYDYEGGSNYTTASHAFDVSELPDVYDLHVTYKAMATDADSTNVALLTSLGVAPAPMTGNFTAGQNAVTVSFNGAKNGTDVTGIHYTTNGDPIALYDGTAGFDDSKWYQIEIVAHIDSVNKATFDYYVYDANKTMLLAEIENVSTSSYAGSVVEPTYITFSKNNSNGFATTAAVDDLNIYAYWEITPVEVKSVKAVALDATEKDLAGEIENNFKEVKVTFAEALKEAPVIKLSGEELEFTSNGSEYTATLPEFLTAGSYTLDVTYAGETTSYSFTVKAATELLVSEFAWYNGENKLSDFSDLSSGANNLTLKVTVYNLTGAPKDLILGYATYANKYMKAVNFNDAVTVANASDAKEYTLPVTVNTNEVDKVSGFVWESLTGLKPLADAAVLD